MTDVVQLEGVTRFFATTPAAVDVSFTVQAGEVFGLLGHNGAGKTTLLRLVNGLLVPQKGQVTTFGMDPAREGDKVRRRTGVLTTYPGLDEYLSPAENLAVYGAIAGLSEQEVGHRTQTLFQRLGLDPDSRLPSRGLSAGLKQRVALARALIHEPELLLLDEPTANLDPIAARDVRDLVRQLADEGRTVIFSTHNLREAQDLCDRVGILRDGHLIAVGSVSDLAAAQAAESVTIRVAHEATDAAVHAMRPHLNGHPVAVQGSRVIVQGAADSEVSACVRALSQADIDVFEVVPSATTLEDVYLTLHRPGAGS